MRSFAACRNLRPGRTALLGEWMRLLLSLCVAAFSAANSDALGCTPSLVMTSAWASGPNASSPVQSATTQQRELRTASDSIFLAEISAQRRVGPTDIETTYTPIDVLQGPYTPGLSLSLRIHAGSTCRRSESVGDLAVIYARSEADDWSIIAALRPEDVLDPDFAVSIHDLVRRHRRGQPGNIPAPVYPD